MEALRRKAAATIGVDDPRVVSGLARACLDRVKEIICLRQVANLRVSFVDRFCLSTLCTHVVLGGIESPECLKLCLAPLA